MTTVRQTAPVDDEPVLAFPRAIVERLLSGGATHGEMQVVLLVGLLTSQSNGEIKPISERSFADHPEVVESGQFEGTPVPNEAWPWSAIELAIARGLILRMAAENASGTKSWLLLNTVGNARFVGKMVAGETPIPDYFWIENAPTRIFTDRPTIFRLYEQNIGPLTPMIAQRLIKALEMYPAEWVEKAFEEAVSYNRRNWRYIARILENWAVDGPGGRNDSR